MPFNADAFRKKLLNAVDKVMKEEQVHTEEMLSVPVGRGNKVIEFTTTGGKNVKFTAKNQVTERSKPGEPPRLETGELHGHVFVQSALHQDRIESINSVSRPSTPDVPRILEEHLDRPIFLGAHGSLARLRDTAVERIVAKFRET
jgi:hypothetical protein